jgi:hypothetical protein
MSVQGRDGRAAEGAPLGQSHNISHAHSTTSCLRLVDPPLPGTCLSLPKTLSGASTKPKEEPFLIDYIFM